MKKALLIVAVLMAMPVSSKNKEFIVESLTLESAQRCADYGKSDTEREFGLTFASTVMSAHFDISIFAPCDWIAHQASEAAKKYMTYEVTEEDLPSGLLVFATPNFRLKFSYLRSVEHVVILSEDKKAPLQPASVVSSERPWSNLAGAEFIFNEVEATFDVAEVEKIRAMNKKGEFYVVVIGEGDQKKDFKIKQKHFRDLLQP